MYTMRLCVYYNFVYILVSIILVPKDENDYNSPMETKYEVLFDETFLGAMPIR